MSAYTYQIELKKNHVVAIISGKRCLIDTGCNKTFGHGPIEIGQKKIQMERKYLSADIEDVRRAGNLSIDNLLGTDVLCSFNFFIDFDAMTIGFSNGPIETQEGGVSFHFDVMLGRTIPIELEINGRHERVLLDTGAQISYFAPRILASFQSVGKGEDFHPLMGSFPTNVYEVPVRLAGVDMSVRSGELPVAFRSLLESLGVDSLLGSDIFTFFNIYMPLQLAQQNIGLSY